MPAAAVIRRVQALSGFTGFKGCVGFDKSVMKCGSSTLRAVTDTVRLETIRGSWNEWCSGEMRRDHSEHQLRRQVTSIVLTLRHESVGIKQD